MTTEVSICIPTYNGDCYIREAIESALNQTFSNIEILIIDDGSTDGTLGIAEKLADRDKRIKIFPNRQNMGLVANWNRCIQIAKGRWVKFLFQDDLLRPNCIENMLNAANGFRFIVCERFFIIEEIVADHIKHFYKNADITLSKVVPGARHISSSTLSVAIWDHIGLNFIGEPTSVMIERSVFFEYGLFNSQLVQLCDLEYWTRIGTNLGICYVPEKLANFRVHSKSASAANHMHKGFHVNYLDLIVLLHDYLYHPNFHNLRIWSNNLNAAKKLLKNTIKGAKILIGDGDNELEKAKRKVEFGNIVSLYPTLLGYL